MQDATPSIAIRNPVPARAILPARVLAKFRGPSTREGNDEERKAP
jgi:hypothetical protein